MFIPLERSALAGAALSSRAMDFDLAKLDNDLDTPSLVIALLVFAVICGLFGGEPRLYSRLHSAAHVLCCSVSPHWCRLQRDDPYPLLSGKAAFLALSRYEQPLLTLRESRSRARRRCPYMPAPPDASLHAIPEPRRPGTAGTSCTPRRIAF